jgi:hypothetical protein
MATYTLAEVMGQPKKTYSIDEVTEAPQEPSLMQQAGAVARDIPRQLGLAARYGAQGLASTAGIVTDPLAYLANQALGTELQPLRSATEGLLTSAGLPSPQTPTERTVGTASELLAGTGGMIRGAAGLAQKAPGLIPLTQRPGLQAASAIGSGLAGGEAREMGASPAVQGAASLAGGLGLPVTTSMLQSGANKIRSMVNPVMQQPTGNPALDIAKAQGYTVPPTMANPSTANRLLEGFAGKLTTGQAASTKNQTITNNLVKRDLRIPEELPITRDTLKLIRDDAGDAYKLVKNTGEVNTDTAYRAALYEITKKYQGAAKDFPDLAKNEAVDIINSVNIPKFNSDSAVDAISVLRSNADDAFAKGNRSTGKAYKEAAGALEDLLGRHLQAIGAPDDAIKNYQNARTTIAKTYSVEDALNPVTGNIIASKLNKQLLKNKPLTGGMRDVATFAGAYPTAAREITSSMPGLSPLDYATALIPAVATQNPAYLAAAMSRPLARSTILSRPYQNMMLTPGQPVSPALMFPGISGLQGGLLSPEQERNNY